jgi:hypothetical protein
MHKITFPFRHQASEEALQIAPGGRIGVLKYYQARTRMADENRGQARLDAAGANGLSHLLGDLIGALPLGSNG